MADRERPRYPKLLIALIRRLLKQHPGLSRDDFDAAFKQARAAAGGHARAERRESTSLADDASEDSFEELIAEVQAALQAAFGGNCWSVATYPDAVVYYVGNQTQPDADDDPDDFLSTADNAWEEAVEDGQPDGDNDADDATTFYKVSYSRDDNGQITFGEQQEVEKDVSWVVEGEEGNGLDAYEEEIDELEDALYAMYGNRCRIVASYPDRVIYCLRNGDDEEHWEQDYSEDEKTEQLTFGDKRKVSMNVEWTPVAAEDSRLVRLLTQSYGISETEANEVLALAYAKAGASGSVSGGKPTLPKNVQAMPEAKQRQWIDVFNSAMTRCQKKGGSNCEKTAFQFANGVLKREKAAGTSVKGEAGITLPNGEVVYLAQKFSDAPWNGNASRYGSTEKFCSSCLIDDNPPGQDKVQDKCLAPWTPVFTRSGWKRADAVTTDDELLTTDLTWGRVTQLHVRTYDGPLYVIAGASLTSTHPVLTGRGWVHIHDVDPIEDVLYLLREVVDRPTFNVRFAEAHQMVASALRISRESDVASLSSGQGVPVVSVYFDDDIAARNERVGNKAANTALSDVSNIQRVEGHIESTLDAGRNVITVCPDRMVLPTRLRTELATFLNDSRRMCQELEFGTAFQADPNLANIIQDRSTPGQGSNATGITTEFIGVVSEFIGNTELHPAGNTDVRARSAANAVMAKLSTTGRAASLSRAVDSIDICAEFLPASDAGALFSPNDGARRTCGSGLTENALRGFRSGDESNLHGAIIPQYTGHVYNFEVAGHPSFFAGLLGVHNCKLPYKTPDGAISRPALRAIAAVLGGARGGVKGVSPQSLAKAKKKHAALMKQAGIGDDDVKASLDYQLAVTPSKDAVAPQNHAPMTITHMHEHPDMGQDDGDGDGTHMHKHTHAGDNSHRHSHANTNIADIESGKAGAGSVKASLDHQLVLDDGDATHPLPKRLSRIDWSQRAFAPVVLRLSNNDIPVWQQLHKIGKWVIPHASGQKIAMTREMGDAIIRNFRAGVVRRGVPLDERHFTDGGGHALGWLEDIRWGSEGQGLPGSAEPDGSGSILYGKFRYNDIGIHKLRNEHYKHISPQYHLNYCDNEIGQCYGPTMLAVASTNNPYLRVRDLQGNAAPQPVTVLDDGLVGFDARGNDDMTDNIKLQEMQARLEAAERQLEAERKERHKTNIEAYLDKEIRSGLTPAVARIAREILLNSAPEMEAVICLSSDPQNTAPTHNLHDAVKALLKEVPHVPVGQVYAHQEDVRPYDPEQATKLDEQLIPQWTKGLLELAKLDDPRRVDGVLNATARQDG